MAETATPTDPGLPAASDKHSLTVGARVAAGLGRGNGASGRIDATPDLRAER